ncbi:regulatory protein, tetR family [Actinobaculum suis]|uniref:Regulatory protein, tetR family n=1 Tax=Actinobaculum suis TaxID=1657 RepID=A0A1G7BKM7_9ACTO|nr:TetR family transcriptional regulator [Actinobaculum suis]MDY5153729.1 TetR family transcriptional regulator [Actinobaculum suis]SDE26835.1 regulatory protein, tetR family [Actinobaculum suis]VDG76579.1 transcriptional regulator [Actinobaculum suis]
MRGVAASDNSTALTKGERRRQEIIEATAKIILEEGPEAVTHRKVASRARCSLSATTHYFKNIDELLSEGGRYNIFAWARAAEEAVKFVEKTDPPQALTAKIELILRACLPHSGVLPNHYRQLLAAFEYPKVAEAYAQCRGDLETAVASLLDFLKIEAPVPVIMALVDGGAVAAISGGRDVRATAAEILEQYLG